jgi:hypothetical protein
MLTYNSNRIKGGGIGNVLSSFFIKKIVPLIKKGAHSLGREGINALDETILDIQSGSLPIEAIKKTGKRFVKKVKRKIYNKLRGGAKKRKVTKKRKTVKKIKKKCKKRKRKVAKRSVSKRIKRNTLRVDDLF